MRRSMRRKEVSAEKGPEPPAQVRKGPSPTRASSAKRDDYLMGRGRFTYWHMLLEKLDIRGL